MEKILLSTLNKDEQRIAVLSNGVISDYISLLQGHEDRKGSIYRGEISVVEPSLDACFVDIGSDKKGFLRFSEIDKTYLGEGQKNGSSVGDTLKPGMPVLVNIVKDSRSEKGPLLSTRIDMASSNMVLVPFPKDAGIRIARSAAESDRERLLDEMGRLELPAGMELIIRSNGTNKPIAELEWQLSSYLVPFWKKIQEVYNKLDKPGLIYEGHNIVNTCLSEYFSPKIAELVCDEEETMQEAKESVSIFMPDMVDKVRLAREDESLFDDNIQAQLDALMSRKVTLPSGGELVIDITEALIAIDINSKRSRGQSSIEKTAYQTNLEAATEITRQIRLRNLSGLIVIDFIDMEEEGNKESLVQHMRRCLRPDKAQISISEISRFGLMEMTRQNIGRPLHEAHTDICKSCQGTGRLPTIGSFARSILDKIRETCLARKQTGSIVLQLPADAATYLLNEKRRELLTLQDDMRIELVILPSYSMNIPDHRIRVDKTARNAQSSKAAYEMDSSSALEQESYLGQSKTQHNYSPPAISNFKAKEQARKEEPKQESKDGFLSRIAKIFSNGTTDKKDDDEKSKERGNNQQYKGKRSRRRNDGRNRGKGSAAKESYSNNRQKQRQGDSRQRKGNNQEREKRESGGQKPLMHKQDQQDKSKPESDNKQVAGQVKPNADGPDARHASSRQPRQDQQAKSRPESGKPAMDQTKPSADGAARPESNRQPRQAPKPPSQASNEISGTAEAKFKQPLSKKPEAKPSKADNNEVGKASKIKSRDPGNSLRRDTAEGKPKQSRSPSSPTI